MPREEIGDVKSAESSQAEQVVNQEQVATDQQSAEQVEQESQETSTQEVKTEVEIKPDRPEINYAMEAARKASEALEIARQLQQQQQAPQPAQPQYSKAQLRAFAENTADAQQKIWALEEIDKMDKVERQAEIRQIFEGQQRKTQEDMARNQAANYVAQNFPECFIKDAHGNNVSWNANSPLAQRIGEYMKNPVLAQNPDGLMAAAKMAAFDLGVSLNKRLVGKINQTTAQLRKEQKKQLITGTGSQVSQDAGKSTITKLAEEYRKTGNKDVFKQLVKARGLTPQV
jgi:hypothetical protein